MVTFQQMCADHRADNLKVADLRTLWDKLGRTQDGTGTLQGHAHPAPPQTTAEPSGRVGHAVPTLAGALLHDGQGPHESGRPLSQDKALANDEVPAGGNAEQARGVFNKDPNVSGGIDYCFHDGCGHCAETEMHGR